jgi:uncharacterized membrane protein YbhN (UPF0104 family)
VNARWTGGRAPSRRSWAAWAASAVITGALLTYLLRGIDGARIVQTALNASPGPFVAFLGLLTAGVFARATRFWILLGRTLPFRVVLGITLVRNLLVDLLPARLGELSYVYLVTTKGQRPLEDGVSSFAVAFLLDLVALSPLVLAALLVVGGGSLVPAWIAWTSSLALGGVGVLAVFIAGPASRMIGHWLAAPRPAPWRSMAAARLSSLGDRFDQAKRNQVLVPALVLSLAVRLCKYGSAYCLVLSLLMPMGYSMSELGVFRIFLGSVAAEVAASLPIHGLAGFGTYEAAWTLTLEELGYPRDHAVISGLLGHAITQGIEYVVGGVALIWLLSRRAEPN